MPQYNKDVVNQSIFITGASSGIGLALSHFFAKPNVTLGLLARRGDLLEVTANTCRAKGATVFIYEANVDDANEMRHCINDFLTKTKRIDIVIANAGIRLEESDDFQDSTVAEQIMATNYLGVIHTFMPFVAHMKQHQTGQLVAISSIAALRGTPNSGAYSASKAAVNLWTESLRLRLMSHRIAVTTISVGFVATPMTSDLPFWMPGLIQPEKAAQLIGHAIAKRKRSITLPWQSKLIWSFLFILPNRLYDKIIMLVKNSNVLERINSIQQKEMQ